MVLYKNFILLIWYLHQGCFADTFCIDAEGTSTNIADCCNAGGAAILQNRVSCIAIDCSGE